MNVHQGSYRATAVDGKLIDCPDEVTGDFYCYHNNLTSLAGCPSSVGDSFWCQNNNLTSLAGCLSSVGGSFICSSNNLTSLVDIAKQLKKCKQFSCTNNEIRSNILGLLLIDGLISIRGYGHALEILNRWLGQGKSALFRCQKELIDAGYEEFAKL